MSLQTGEVLRVFQLPVAEEELVVASNPVPHQNLGAELVLIDFVQVRGDVGQYLVVGLMVGPQPPDVLHGQGGEFATGIAAVNFGHAQGAVGQQAGGIGPSQTQLGEESDVDRYLSFRAVLAIGDEVGALVLAPEQLAIDTGVLQYNILPGRCQSSGVGKIGSFDQLPVVVGFKHPLDVFEGVPKGTCPSSSPRSVP